MSVDNVGVENFWYCHYKIVEDKEDIGKPMSKMSVIMMAILNVHMNL